MKVEVDEFGNYRYRSDIPHVNDRESLLKEVNRRPEVFGRAGVPLEKLVDCYPEASADVRALVRSGLLVAVEHIVVTEKPTATLFPRGPLFCVELKAPSAAFGAHARSKDGTIATTYDTTEEVRRGEAVWVAPPGGPAAVAAAAPDSGEGPGPRARQLGEVARVSSLRSGGPERRHDSVSASESIEKVYSVQLERVLGASRKTEVAWARPFSGHALPLDERGARPGPVKLLRFGASTDVGELWRETRASLPDDADALAKLLEVCVCVEKNECPPITCVFALFRSSFRSLAQPPF